MMDCTKVSYASKGFANHKKALHHHPNCALQERQHAPWKASDWIPELAIQQAPHQTPHYAQNWNAEQMGLNDPQQAKQWELATQNSPEKAKPQSTQQTAQESSDQAIV